MEMTGESVRSGRVTAWRQGDKGDYGFVQSDGVTYFLSERAITTPPRVGDTVYFLSTDLRSPKREGQYDRITFARSSSDYEAELQRREEERKQRAWQQYAANIRHLAYQVYDAAKAVVREEIERAAELRCQAEELKAQLARSVRWFCPKCGRCIQVESAQTVGGSRRRLQCSEKRCRWKYEFTFVGRTQNIGGYLYEKLARADTNISVHGDPPICRFDQAKADECASLFHWADRLDPHLPNLESEARVAISPDQIKTLRCLAAGMIERFKLDFGLLDPPA